MGKPLIDDTFLLEKFPGKGGWTYAALPSLQYDKSNPFGWMTVKGFVDEHELKHYKLMPMGTGHLFLPVKTDIRKKINKQAGDWVKVILYRDEAPLEIPQEIIDCFDMEPKSTYQAFKHLTDGEKKRYTDWIYSAKTADTKASRILEMMKNLGEQHG